MKKKIFAAIIAVLLVCAPLTACGESFTNPKVEGKQDTSYVVTSNGGSAVQYGNYVYYINGYRGYDDADGSENYWGNVVKGGLYRSELIAGEKVEYDYMTSFGTKVSGLWTFESKFDAETSYNFVTNKETVVTGYEKDEDGKIAYDDNDKPIEITEEINTPVAYRIASKTIGTSGYSKGGIFIYDEHVYYATPSNNQDRHGDFETDKTMFYRTNLDGTGTVRLYTTKSSSSSSEYAFYKQNGTVYLTVHDGSKIVSVEIGDKKVKSVNEIATDVTSVLFPVRDVYYNGIDTNEAEDFIYYTRAINEDDPVRAGNITIAMRPDGSEQMQIFANGNTITLKDVDGGYLFYQDAQTSGNVIMYTNLHEQFMQNSSSYKEAYESKKSAIIAANGENSPLIGHQSGVALDVENISSYSEIICFRPNRLSNQVYSLCMSSSSLFIYDGVEMKTIYNGSVSEIYDIVGTNVFFRNSSGNYYMTNAYTPAADNTVYTLGEGMNTNATFGLDVVGNFVMMFGAADDYASDYALFVNLDRIDEGTQFVGVKLDEDKYDPTVELDSDAE